jgi:hypothetical protein
MEAVVLRTLDVFRKESSRRDTELREACDAVARA